MRIAPASTTRAAFSVLEVLLTLALLGILVQKAVLIVDGALTVSATDTVDTAMDDQARLLLRRIGFAVMGSQRASLNPTEEQPFDSAEIRYQVHLGIEEGEVVWSDPEKVALSAADESQLFWSRNPDAPGEQRMVWSNLVAPYLEGELPNGMDDNGNGLIDEKGLSFVVDRNAVTIRLTLERVDPEGRRIARSVETTVTCRNLEAVEP
jgi:hypothetical protein